MNFGKAAKLTGNCSYAKWICW